MRPGQHGFTALFDTINRQNPELARATGGSMQDKYPEHFAGTQTPVNNVGSAPQRAPQRNAPPTREGGLMSTLGRVCSIGAGLLTAYAIYKAVAASTEVASDQPPSDSKDAP